MARVAAPTFGRLRGRGLETAAQAGLDGGEPDDGEHVGGQGAGLPPGLRNAPTPSFQGSEYARVSAGRFQPRLSHSWTFEIALVAILAPEPARAAR